MLQGYAWPGNIRELENEIYRAAPLVEERSTVQAYHFSPEAALGESMVQDVVSRGLNYDESLNRFRRWLISEALLIADANRSEVARRLGMHRPNLVALIKRLGIDEGTEA